MGEKLASLLAFFYGKGAERRKSESVYPMVVKNIHLRLDYNEAKLCSHRLYLLARMVL